jgi:hypothetical protein
MAGVGGISPGSLNNSGDVAFVGFYGTGSGIFTQHGVLAKTGDTIGGLTLTGITPGYKTYLNDSGLAAFRANYSGGTGVFTQFSLVAKPGDTIGGLVLGNVFAPSVNDAGDIVFASSYVSGGNGIFSSNSVLAKTGDTIDGDTFFAVGGPSLNNLGEFAFYGLYFGGDGVYTQNGTSAKVAKAGDTIGGQTLVDYSGVPRAPALNDNGEVAFTWQISRSPPILSLFRDNALLATPGDTIGDKTLNQIPEIAPALNNNGKVAFVGNYLGGSGVFTQDDLVAVRGDNIAGKILDWPSGVSINDNGEIAFAAYFLDGTEGIVLAVPSTPLPGDFDLDGDVDGADFLEWQRDPSVGSLADWQTNYGMVASLSASSGAIPEPTTCTLVLAALCLAMSRRRIAAR